MFNMFSEFLLWKLNKTKVLEISHEIIMIIIQFGGLICQLEIPRTQITLAEYLKKSKDVRLRSFAGIRQGINSR